jgi:hypothetical protein
MSLVEEVTDPRGLAVAGLLGGIAWAVGISAGIAVVVGVLVLAMKVAADVLLRRTETVPPSEPAVRQQSPEGDWLRRAERAVRSFEDLSASTPPGPIAQRCSAIGEQARTTLEALRRLAGQTSAVGTALSRVNLAELSREETRVTADLKAVEDPGVQAELQRSWESIQGQLAVYRRLEQASRMLLARVDSGALALEGLVVRLAEILALAETASDPVEGVGQIDALADELEGLRSGLAETEDASRRALSAFRVGG